MTSTPTAATSPRKPLRLWPGIGAALLVCLIRYAMPVVFPDPALFAVMGGIVGSLAILLWWLGFSRAPWLERLAAIALMILAPIVTARLVHESIATGMMGMMLPLYSVPVMSVALVAWAVATRHFPSGLRRVSLVASILLACGAFALLRTDGVRGAGSDIRWRWTPTSEERLLSQTSEEPVSPPSAPAVSETTREGVPPVATNEAASTAPEHEVNRREDAVTAPAPVATLASNDAEWPGFRGPDRDSSVHGVQIDTDW